MRIAFIVHDYNRSGGHSRYVAELASRFSQEHEVHVFSNGIETNDCDRNVRFHRVPAWRATALTSILSFAVTSRFFSYKKFDIVHIQGFCGPRGNVITTHQCNEAWYRGLKKTGTVTFKDRLFRAVTSPLERRLYRSAGTDTRIISCSKRVRDDVHTLYGCESHIDVIYHGVDLQTFSPATRQEHRHMMRSQIGIATDDVVFLFVGNLRKGARQCIEALAGIGRGVLLIASFSKIDEYQSLAKRLNCSERVKFLGPSKQIYKLFAASDIFLLPTPYDPFALVCTEAMACGLPVIVSCAAGVSELIDHGVNGLLIKNPASATELAEQMQTAMQDYQHAVAMGKAACATVQRFSWQEAAEETMGLYQQMLMAALR